MLKVEISIETLEKWQRELDSPKNPARACFNVSEEMFDILQQAPRQVEKQQKEAAAKSTRGLTFNEIIPGNVYEMFNIGGQKYAPLNGKTGKVVQKNRTKVVVALEEDAGPNFKKGHKLTVPPELLRQAN